MKKAGLWILILGILLVVAVVFIVIYNVILPTVAAREKATSDAGFEEGYVTAIINIAQNSLNCQIVPLSIENQTINLVDASCKLQAE